MATPFFGRRNTDNSSSITTLTNLRTKPGSGYSTPAQAPSAEPIQKSTSDLIPVSKQEVGRKLTVGPKIKLKVV